MANTKLPAGSDPYGSRDRHDPTTFSAPIGGGNKWEQYFGPATHEIKTNAYDKYAYETYDLPEAYRGKNMFLRDTIDGFIMEDNTFYTRVLLPYAQTDQIHIKWNEWRFNQTLAGRVPHEGVSRLITSSKRAFKDHTIRRGLAFILEHGFMNTAEGREQYRRNLMGIKQCVQETNNHDVISALLNARRYDKEWEKRHGFFSRPLNELMRKEVQTWAIVQKDQPGFEILHEEYKKRLSRWGVVPDVWVFPAKMSIYCAMAPPAADDYQHGKADKMIVGQATAASFNNFRGSLGSFRGVRIFETRLFDVYEGELPVDLLMRNQQVGEYYVMNDPHRYSSETDHKREDRDIIVYNEPLDNWARLTFEEALRSCINLPPGERSRMEYVRRAVRAAGRAISNLVPGWRRRVLRKPNELIGSKLTPTESVAHVAAFDEPEHLALPLASHFNATEEEAQHPGYVRAVVEAHAKQLHHIASSGEPLEEHADATQNALHALAVALHGDGDETAETREQYVTDRSSGIDELSNCVADIHDDMNTAAEQLEQYKFVGIGAGVKPLGAYFKDAAHFAVATRDMPTNMLPDFMRAHMVPDVSKPTHRRVELQAASKKNDGFGLHNSGHVCVYDSAIRANGTVGVARKGDTLGIMIEGNRQKQQWNGINAQEARNIADRQFETPRVRQALLDPVSICRNLVANADQVRTVDVDQRRDVSQRSEWRHVRNLGAPRLHKGGGSGDPVDNVLYTGYDGTGTQQRTPDSNELSYARKIIAHADRMQIGQIIGDRGDPAAKNLPQHGHNSTSWYAGNRMSRISENMKGLAPDAQRGAPAQYGELNTFAIPVTFDNVKLLLDANCRVPFDVLLLRPFMEYQMSSAILMKSGWTTGATFVGHSDFELGDDVISKLHYGNFTFYSKSVVTNPKNIIIAENVFCQAYVRGNGITYFQAPANGQYSLPAPPTGEPGRDSSMDPVGYNPVTGEHTASLIAVLVPYGTADNLPNPLDIEAHKEFDISADNTKLQATRPAMVKPSYFMDADYLTEMFQLHQFSRDRLDPASEPFITYERLQNTICYRGHQFSYDTTTKSMSAVTVNTGHWGKNIYPGCGAVRAGDVKYLEKQHFRPTVSLARSLST